jgi:hypothetical protein
MPVAYISATSGVRAAKISLSSRRVLWNGRERKSPVALYVYLAALSIGRYRLKQGDAAYGVALAGVWLSSALSLLLHASLLNTVDQQWRGGASFVSRRHSATRKCEE